MYAIAHTALRIDDFAKLYQEEDKHFTVKLSDESFDAYNIDAPALEIDVTKKDLKKLYYDMVSIR